ncbi:helix-turn-helix domain-containing protein [Candidatus Woesearchaeota archaeon]|nr:helix-turn-helix domain-containing protein [Candidatus Woesearchaeota archaeon]
MATHMPQEIEVWYILPSLRRELSKALVKKHSMTQREVSALLGITESAVSQYLASKRASEIKFSREELEKIWKAANDIATNKDKAAKIFYSLTVFFRGSKTMCSLHHKLDNNVPKNCDVCIENVSGVRFK